MRTADHIQPDDLLITQRLYRRSPRVASLERELGAYRELSSIMASVPSKAIQRFLDLALELCPAAGSAGLSELTEDDGEPIFSWTALSGELASFVGGSAPRDFSPCGLCLDNHHTILVERPARVFTYLEEARSEIVESLIVPLYDTGKRPIGTLWIVSHDRAGKFDATDARVMEQLAIQLVLAIKLRRKSAIAARLEAAVRDNEVLVSEVRHRVKNMIQMTSSLLELQERGATSGETRAALKEAQSRLLVLASVYENLLHGSVGARELDAAELITSLVHALRDSSATGTRIDVEAQCEPVNVSIAQAVPVGLIVNEAVTNALKHAFRPGECGEILVRLSAAGERCTLTVSDDGKGIADSPRAGSLGMQLMRNLTRQLGGSLAIEGERGTTVLVQWSKGDSLPRKRAADRQLHSRADS